MVFKDTIHENAVEVLRLIMRERNWHQQKYPSRKASGYKDLLKKGKLSYEKCSEILYLLGYKKIHEETWEKENELA